MRGTWQTTDSGGGGGLGVAVLIILAAALLGPAVAAAAAAVATAVAELVHIMLITVAVLLGLGAAGLVALAADRVHRWRTGAPARVSVPAPPPSRAVEAPTAPCQGNSFPDAARPAIEASRQVHLHFHGVDAADVAELLHRHGER
jgi:hypothetical protein